MRILVTGPTGFVGSYLIKELLDRGHQVGAIIRPESDAWRISEVRERVRFIVGSLDDISALRSAIATFEPDAIAHLAWWGVRNADRNSAIQARNIGSAVELAGLAAELGVKVFVGAGSQAEYGQYHRAISEDDPARPTTLYGMAKVASATMAAELCHQNGVRFAWVRLFSTYGPKDHDHWLIPQLIRALKARQRMPLTKAEQQWGFLHVQDAASGIRTVIESETASGMFNLGSPEAPPLRETILAIRDLVDPAGELGFGDIPYRPDQVMVLKADVTRLQSLGWQPRIDLEGGLREMVCWYNARE
jgi:UDP-glucose 4-epimerase